MKVALGASALVCAFQAGMEHGAGRTALFAALATFLMVVATADWRR